jgi:hypothetical protein
MSQSGAPSAPNFAAGGTSVPPASASHHSECDCLHYEFCNNPIKILRTLATLSPDERLKYAGIPASAMQLCNFQLSFKGPREEYADGGEAAYSCCCLTCVAAAITAAGPCHAGKCTPSCLVTHWNEVYCTTCTKEYSCVWCYKDLKDQADKRIQDEQDACLTSEEAALESLPLHCHDNCACAGEEDFF